MKTTRIFLVGYMGSGKSAMGRLLAKRFNFSFVDLDHYIEGKYHKTIAQLFQDEGEATFREKEKSCLREVGEFENTVIATGGGAPCFFDSMEYMNRQGLTIYLRLQPEQLVDRLQKGKAGVRPLINGKSPEDLLVFIRSMLEKRSAFYEMAQRIIEGNDEEITRQINDFYVS
ncbi:MAG: shikimate kinase [Paludibacter sp.]|nr:shikimate kinase [Paludibacter sp.]